MPSDGYFVDSMLLTLLVVGRTDKGLISRHRRLGGYSVDDYQLLLDVIADGGGRVYTTPNTLTETSNLLWYGVEEDDTRLPRMLARLIEEGNEVVVASAAAAQETAFQRFGLTDSVLASVASPSRPLLTVDGALYGFIAAKSTTQAAVNFNHLREIEKSTER